MEDDVEVELELEKQLALAHELFPTWPKVMHIILCHHPDNTLYLQSGLPPNWWQLNGNENTDPRDDQGGGGGGEGEATDHAHYQHQCSPSNIGPVPAHIWLRSYNRLQSHVPPNIMSDPSVTNILYDQLKAWSRSPFSIESQ